MSSEQKILTRDVEASVVPIGTKVTLQKGETAHITQSLGGTYTVIVHIASPADAIARQRG